MQEKVSYQRRYVDDYLDEWMKYFPAVSIEGPKAVGKTATARQRAQTQRFLDKPEQAAIITAAPDRVVEGTPPILIDEWQNIPSTWDSVRRAVDDDPQPGRFILTGSASSQHGRTHSGAGRIHRIRMWPLTLPERGVTVPTVSLAHLLTGERTEVAGQTDFSLQDYVEEITKSGLPAICHLPQKVAEQRVSAYVDRIVEHEIMVNGRQRSNSPTVMRWLRAYSAAVSTTATYDSLRDAASAGEAEKLAKQTDIVYRDVLERLWIVEPLLAWEPHTNYLKRLTKAPKHCLADPAFAAAALGLTADALLEGAEPLVERPHSHATMLGALFECLAIQHLRVFAHNNNARVYHARTQGGRVEIDIIIERRDGRFLPIEVKLSPNPPARAFQHLHQLQELSGNAMLDGVVITTGTEAYRRKDGIAIVPLALLGP